MWAAFGEQFADLLELIAGALQSGLLRPQAVDAAA